MKNHMLIAHEFLVTKAETARSNSVCLKLNPTVVGTIAEYRVIADLMSKGFAVFKACSQSSPCDLIALIDGFSYRVEVTLAQRTETGRVVHPRHDPEKYDILARVLPNEILYTIHSLPIGTALMRGSGSDTPTLEPQICQQN